MQAGHFGAGIAVKGILRDLSWFRYIYLFFVTEQVLSLQEKVRSRPTQDSFRIQEFSIQTDLVDLCHATRPGPCLAFAFWALAYLCIPSAT